jgi:TonB family protein
MRHMLASTLMLSSILFPVAANATSSHDDVAASTPNLRVSTGVTAPVLTQPLSIELPDGLAKTFVSTDTQVGLSLTVDSNGRAQDIKVVKPSNPYWDARVVDAIQRSHFRPGKVDDTPTPVELNLTVDIAH